MRYLSPIITPCRPWRLVSRIRSLSGVTSTFLSTPGDELLPPLSRSLLLLLLLLLLLWLRWLLRLLLLLLLRLLLRLSTL